MGVVEFVRFIQARPVGSFGHALFVGFIRVAWVHSGAPWRWSRSFRFLKFIRARARGACIHSVSRLGVVGFIRACPGSRTVNSSVPCGSSVNSCSLGSLAFWNVLRVVGFIRVRPGGHSSAPLVSSGSFVFVGFIRVPWGMPGSFGLILARPGGRCVHLSTY